MELTAGTLAVVPARLLPIMTAATAEEARKQYLNPLNSISQSSSPTSNSTCISTCTHASVCPSRFVRFIINVMKIRHGWMPHNMSDAWPSPLHFPPSLHLCNYLNHLSMFLSYLSLSSSLLPISLRTVRCARGGKYHVTETLKLCETLCHPSPPSSPGLLAF